MNERPITFRQEECNKLMGFAQAGEEILDLFALRKEVAGGKDEEAFGLFLRELRFGVYTVEEAKFLRGAVVVDGAALCAGGVLQLPPGAGPAHG